MNRNQRLEDMAPQEARPWIRSMRERLQQKMQRERAYLDRRAAHGIHTPTDDAYKADQVLESELLMLLEGLEHSLDSGEVALS